MREVVTIREIEQVLALTDRLGIHREQVVIPLAARHPGGVRKRPDGKLEVVVEAEGDLGAWLSGLEPQIRRLLGY